MDKAIYDAIYKAIYNAIYRGSWPFCKSWEPILQDRM